MKYLKGMRKCTIFHALLVKKICWTEVFLHEVEDKYLCVLKSCGLIHTYHRESYLREIIHVCSNNDFLSVVNSAKFWLYQDPQICSIDLRNSYYCLVLFGHKSCPGDFSTCQPSGSLAKRHNFLAQGALLPCVVKYGNVHLLWVLLKLDVPELKTPKRTRRFSRERVKDGAMYELLFGGGWSREYNHLSPFLLFCCPFSKHQLCMVRSDSVPVLMSWSSQMFTE